MRAVDNARTETSCIARGAAPELEPGSPTHVKADAWLDANLGFPLKAILSKISRGWKPKEPRMATQIIMDHTGDSRHEFDPEHAEALKKAEERFKELTSAGFTAAVRDANGGVSVTRSFDPTANETLFYPRLVGG